MVHLAPGMLTRPAWHDAKARESEAKDRAEAETFFEAEATMHEAEAGARYSRNKNHYMSTLIRQSQNNAGPR